MHWCDALYETDLSITPPESPLRPRLGAKESNSSKKIIQGAAVLALQNTYRDIEEKGFFPLLIEIPFLSMTNYSVKSWHYVRCKSKLNHSRLKGQFVFLEPSAVYKVNCNSNKNTNNPFLFHSR